jgi:hypothetical protein
LSKLVGEVARQVRLSEALTDAQVFSDLIKYRLLANINQRFAADLAAQAGRQRAADILTGLSGHSVRELSLRLRAPTSAGSTTNSTWAAPLASYRLVSESWLAALSPLSIFETLRPFMVNLPLHSRAGITTIDVSASSVGEGDPVPVSLASFSGQDVQVAKAMTIVVVSRELAKLVGASGSSVIEQSLRSGVAVSVDSRFLSIITTGITAYVSSGLTSAAVRNDLGRALRDIAIGEGTKLFAITTPAVARALAVSCLESGAPSFPQVGPAGGEILPGVPLLVSTAAAPGTMTLLDASGLAGTSEEIEVDVSANATVEMNTAPNSPAVASTVLESLWQRNNLGVSARRWLGAARLRSNSVALISNVNYSGNSP